MLVLRNIQEALDDPNWKVAVMEEMNDLKRSVTWELVDLPKEKRIVGFLTGSDKEELERMKRRLATEFEIKDLGALKYFLGMEFARSKEAETPIEPNIKLLPLPSKDDEVKDKEQYQMLVRRLIYLSHACPDIAFSVSMVEAFTDANWAESVVDRHSTSSYCTFVGGNLVTWRNKKQNVVAKSSAEAKFRSIALGICEVLWIRRLLEELKISSTLPMKLYCDNKAVILIVIIQYFTIEQRHVEVDKHFIKEKLENGLTCMLYIPTTEQVV
ncbi:Retrovirus-related Pol polyprotein from transposon RE1 [Vitis vinifera]|uniref:Retrovirus-related Pol polyprotein from transposon RE1 n=1 Tax=Vitis vinifera TaxID=29760 RepID=A0A438GLG1_VITVI|nr:Retrovirus-related Pol polyprotein from transposon RE1 [Vitis vinifera]